MLYNFCEVLHDSHMKRGYLIGSDSPWIIIVNYILRYYIIPE